MKVAEVLIPDITNSTIVSIKDHASFDGLCSRISFNSVSQIKSGSENGVQCVHLIRTP